MFKMACFAIIPNSIKALTVVAKRSILDDSRSFGYTSAYKNYNVKYGLFSYILFENILKVEGYMSSLNDALW